MSMTLLQQFNEYQREYELNEQKSMVYINRKKLISRILKEERDILHNNLFLTLMEHEESFIRNSSSSTNNHKVSNLLTLTKLMLSQQGGPAFSVNERKELFGLEIRSEGRPRSFYADSTEWLLDLLEGGDSESEAKQQVLQYTSNFKFLHNIANAVPMGVRGLVSYHEEMERILSDKDKVSSDLRNRRTVMMGCVTLFLLNKSFGDEVNANYYLMKAVELNYQGYENEYVLYFLKNLYLLS